MKTYFACFLCLVFALTAAAQETKRIDHLTLEEDNLIHDSQELDKRIEIYVKAIERRFAALNNAAVVTEKVKEKKKEAEKWGALPTGTRAELLADVNSILNEAVRNIDNAAEHNTKSPILPKALKTLADSCSRFVVQLKPFGETVNQETVRAAATDAAQTCREVIEAESQQTENTSAKSPH